METEQPEPTQPAATQPETALKDQSHPDGGPRAFLRGKRFTPKKLVQIFRQGSASTHNGDHGRNIDGRGGNETPNGSSNVGPSAPHSGRFQGIVQLRDRSRTIEQDLEIHFDLEIEPQKNDRTRAARCRCLIDSLEARATRHENTRSETPYVLDVLSVSISANGGQGFTPEDVAPVQENFTVKQSETVTRGIQLVIGYTGSPEGQLTISRGESNAAELSPISIAIRPLHIGASLTLQEQMWEYKLQRKSQTWIELSGQRPPQRLALSNFPVPMEPFCQAT